MSVSTTTTEIIPATVESLLVAYTVHHSGEDLPPQSELSPSPTNREDLSPPNWPTDRNRIPSYRPTDIDHTLSSRPAGQNATEAVIVRVMFLGVYVSAVSPPFQAVQIISAALARLFLSR